MTVLAGRRESFSAAHQVRDPARAFRERLRPELRKRYTAADL
jgi:hypothetical protein